VAIGLLIGWAINGFGQLANGSWQAIRDLLCGALGLGTLSTLTVSVLPDRGFGFLESWPRFAAIRRGRHAHREHAAGQATRLDIALSVSYKAFDLNESYYSGFNRLQFQGFGGMDNNCVAIELVAAVGFMFFFFFHGQTLVAKGDRRGKLRFAGECHHVLVFARRHAGAGCDRRSRLLADSQTPFHYAIFTVGVLVALRLAGPATLERFYTSFADKEERDASAESRIELWKDCVTLAIESPMSASDRIISGTMRACGLAGRMENWPTAFGSRGWPSSASRESAFSSPFTSSACGIVAADPRVVSDRRPPHPRHGAHGHRQPRWLHRFVAVRIARRFGAAVLRRPRRGRLVEGRLSAGRSVWTEDEFQAEHADPQPGALPANPWTGL
jgi:hypothetical protein